MPPPPARRQPEFSRGSAPRPAASGPPRAVRRDLYNLSQLVCPLIGNQHLYNLSVPIFEIVETGYNLSVPLSIIHPSRSVAHRWYHLFSASTAGSLSVPLSSGQFICPSIGATAPCAPRAQFVCPSIGTCLGSHSKGAGLPAIELPPDQGRFHPGTRRGRGPRSCRALASTVRSSGAKAAPGASPRHVVPRPRRRGRPGPTTRLPLGRAAHPRPTEGLSLGRVAASCRRSLIVLPPPLFAPPSLGQRGRPSSARLRRDAAATLATRRSRGRLTFQSDSPPFRV